MMDAADAAATGFVIFSPCPCCHRGPVGCRRRRGAWLFERAREGKEDPQLSRALRPLQAGKPRWPLVWLHAASVGESGVACADEAWQG